MKKVLIFGIILNSLLIFAQVKLTDKEVLFATGQKIYLEKELDNYIQFLPNIKNIEFTNSLLKSELRKEKIDYDNYYFQYVGVKTFDKKYIYVNASCSKKDYFESKILTVKGGGKCYFISLINIEKNRIEFLKFNAPK